MDPLITVAQLAAYTKGAISATDPRAEDSIAAVSAAIRKYCGWHITPSIEETITLDGPGGHYLDLPSLQVTDLKSIVVLRGDTQYQLSTERYDWSPLGSVEIRNRHVQTADGGWFTAWPNRYRSIVVTMVHGFESAPDVLGVALAVAARQLASPSGAVREQAGTVVVQHATTSGSGGGGAAGGIALLGPELAVLDPYRIKGA